MRLLKNDAQILRGTCLTLENSECPKGGHGVIWDGLLVLWVLEGVVMYNYEVQIRKNDGGGGI